MIGEARDVKPEEDGTSFAYVRLFNMPRWPSTVGLRIGIFVRRTLTVSMTTCIHEPTRYARHVEEGVADVQTNKLSIDGDRGVRHLVAHEIEALPNHQEAAEQPTSPSLGG